MNLILSVAALLLLTALAYRLGRSRALAAVDGRPARLHSVPGYYGTYVALWCVVPALLLLLLWSALRGPLVEGLVMAGLPADMAGLSEGEVSLLMSEVRSVALSGMPAGRPVVAEAAARYDQLLQLGNWLVAALVLAASVLGLAWARRRISPSLRARTAVEKFLRLLLILAASFAVLVTVGIVLSLVGESARFFARVPLWEFLFGLKWAPQTAIHADQVGTAGAFGAVPLFLGTALIALIAMLVAVPLGLLSAIYLSEYAARPVRGWLKPLLEILAGVPTVVYGFFAALTVAPFIRDVGGAIGLNVASESALAAGLVMGVMIIPFVSSLSDDVINAVPQTLRDGSYAMGATKSETIRQVVIPAALPGIVGAVLLAVSRAIGETMIVVMAAGLAANLTANPLQAVTTVTVQIATLLVGDQEFDSPKTLSAFALGLVLFVATLLLNVIALRVVRKYREKYD